MIKKILYTLGVLVFLVLALLILIPYLYQDEIKDRLLKEVNKDLDGELTIEDFGINLIRSFPDLQVVLENARLTSNIDTTRPILHTQSLSLDLDIMSVIRGEETVQVNAVHLNDPVVYVSIDENGLANYEIYQSSPASKGNSADSATYKFNVSDYGIDNGHLIYRDISTGSYFELKNLNHSGHGSYQGDELNLSTSTQINQITVTSGNTSYLNQANLDSDIDIVYNLNSQRIDLDKNDIQLNNLQLQATGWVQPQNDGIALDLQINAPGNQFGEVWSVVPASMKKDIADVRTSGSFKLNGTIKGKYQYDSGALPAIHINFDIDNGAVSYPALPQKLSDIFANITFIKNEGSSSNYFNIKRLEFSAGNSYLKTRAEVTQLNNDLKSDGFADINLNLSDLPLEMESEGRVIADISFGGTFSDIQAKNYDQLKLEGEATLENIKLKSMDAPEILVNIPQVNFSPEQVIASQVDIKAGNSDFSGQLDIGNPLGFVADDAQPVIRAKTNSQMIDVNEFLSDNSSSAENQSELSPEKNEVVTSFLPMNMKMDWSGKIDKLIYEEYVVEDLEAMVQTDGQQLMLNDARATYNESDFSGSANIRDIPAFLSNTGSMKGNVDLRGRSLDLNKFMTTEEDVTNGEAESAGVLVLPENMNITINTDIKEIIYSDLTIRNLNGELALADQTVDFNRLAASFLDGEMFLKGNFSSDGKSKPSFNFKYDIKKMPFEGITKQIDFINKIVPISKYIDGIFNSTLVMEGFLDENMSPDLSTLTASGYIETLKGALGKIPFLEKLSNKIAVKELNGIALENTKNWFEIKEGKFLIQPFDYEFQGMDFKVDGSTGLDKTINFNIQADIPKEKFDQLPGGDQINKGISWLTNEAASRGLPFGEIKSYRLGIDLNGEMTNPSIKVKLLDFTKGSVQNALENQKEEFKKQLTDTLQKKKQEVIEDTKEKINEKKEEVVDTVKKTIQKEVDKKVDDVKEEIKKKTGAQVDSLLDKNSKETIDKIKDKLDKWDIFKKKK